MNEKDAQIELMQQAIDALGAEASAIRTSLENHQAPIAQINSSRDSQWIAEYAGVFNGVAACVDKAAGEVDKTSNTLRKIRQELIAEDTRGVQ